MRNNKKFFMCGNSIEEVLDMTQEYNAHFLVRKISGVVVLANELHANYYGVDAANDLLEENFYNILPCNEAKIAKSHDELVINRDMSQLFYEKCLKNECISIKTPVKDSSKNTIGIGVIDLYPNKMSLCEITLLINEIMCLPKSTKNSGCGYILNTHKLSMLSTRERQLIHYLIKGISCKEIAKILFISYRTIEKHIENIKDKLGCRSRLDIVNKIFELTNF